MREPRFVIWDEFNAWHALIATDADVWLTCP
jgi:hypothetical protein